MKKNLKKVFALGLAATMVMGMSISALADETAKPLASKEATYSETITKAYAVSGATTVGEEGKDGYVNGNAIYPAESLSFTSEAADTNPDPAKNLTINSLSVEGNANQKLAINVPSYNKAGTYHYTIKETAGDKTGVTYSTEELKVSVLVTYDYDDSDNDGYRMTSTVGITKNAAGDKDKEFNNTYDLGSLDVSKQVTGKLGDRNREFDIYVTFTSSNAIASDITYVEAEDIKTITAEDVNKGDAKVTLTLKDDEVVHFYNIPAGVTYKVEEDSKYSADTNKNGENGYDAPSYNYSDDNKAISKEDTDTVVVTNNKDTEVDTGISLDNMPYLMMLAMTVLGAFGFVSKKRKEEEMF